ncbi:MULTISPECIES: DUF4129 domain-containing protein [unclassified Microbacterium]|uniref:DUF4129 domain-containing protein n=1 Tax=Microbacterium TaxID=33882 RepID=UPI003BA3C7EF
MTGAQLATGALRLVLATLPDGDEARDWAEDELGDPVYDAAQPTLLDRIAGAIADFFARLFDTELGAEWNPLLAIVVTGVIAIVVVCAFLIWGRPRSAHRAPSRSALLFGEDEHRTAAELRASAARRAEAGDWTGAVVDRFRALARSLEERDLLDAPPGTTAQRFTVLAKAPFPAHADALSRAAAAFDDVRYLRREGTAEMYAAVAQLDDAISAARPARLREGVLG